MIKVVYASKHGHSKRVAERFDNYYNVCDNPSLDSKVILFICPTYGDEELHLDMEDFLQTISVRNKEFVICELGNYYGYDDFRFGALVIIKKRLQILGWKEFFPSLSLDSLPEMDWKVFEEWKERLDDFSCKSN